jgi:hypothetical protein
MFEHLLCFEIQHFPIWLVKMDVLFMEIAIKPFYTGMAFHVESFSVSEVNWLQNNLSIYMTGYLHYGLTC